MTKGQGLLRFLENVQRHEQVKQEFQGSEVTLYTVDTRLYAFVNTHTPTTQSRPSQQCWPSMSINIATLVCDPCHVFHTDEALKDCGNCVPRDKGDRETFYIICSITILI